MGLFIGSSRLLDRLRFIRETVKDIQAKVNSSDNRNHFNNLQNRIQKIEYDLQDIKIILQKINQQSNYEFPNTWDFIRLKNYINSFQQKTLIMLILYELAVIMMAAISCSTTLMKVCQHTVMVLVMTYLGILIWQSVTFIVTCMTILFHLCQWSLVSFTGRKKVSVVSIK